MSRRKTRRELFQSRFICLHCMKENMLGRGISRKTQREKYHIKDLTCFNKGCNGKITKNLEVRSCDDFLEIFERAEELHKRYYQNETSASVVV